MSVHAALQTTLSIGLRILGCVIDTQRTEILFAKIRPEVFKCRLRWPYITVMRIANVTCLETSGDYLNASNQASINIAKNYSVMYLDRTFAYTASLK